MHVTLTWILNTVSLVHQPWVPPPPQKNKPLGNPALSWLPGLYMAKADALLPVRNAIVK